MFSRGSCVQLKFRASVPNEEETIVSYGTKSISLQRAFLLATGTSLCISLIHSVSPKDRGPRCQPNDFAYYSSFRMSERCSVIFIRSGCGSL